MKTLVIDASVAIKWVVTEPDTPRALALRKGLRLIAPDLLIAECANILWKKVQRGNLDADMAELSARLLQRVDIDLVPMRELLPEATRLAISLSHPAYDCLYLALALSRQVQFVTADVRLINRLATHPDAQIRASVLSLANVGLA